MSTSRKSGLTKCVEVRRSVSPDKGDTEVIIAPQLPKSVLSAIDDPKRRRHISQLTLSWKMLRDQPRALLTKSSLFEVFLRGVA